MIAGVDFDSFAVYIAALPFEREHEAARARFTTIRFREKNEAGADEAFAAALRLPARLRFELAPTPAAAWIERPMSEQRKHLVTMGRVQGLIVATLLDLGVEVIEEVTPQEWKLAVAGKGYGNAKKAAVHEHLARLWPAELPADENMRDALAIAWTAREENARGR